MARVAFERELKLGAMRPLGVGKQDLDIPEVKQRRWHRRLTPQLIEAFVMKYLHYKYDNPLPTPPFHREVWAACADEGYPHVLTLAPRGHAKSTSITEAYGLAALLFRQRDFALILSNTYSQSTEFLADVALEFRENEELIRDFEVAKVLTDAEDDLVILFRDGHKIRLVARGSGQKVRGIKWHKRRPNLVLFDDLEDDAEILNKDTRTKFSNWFMRAVLPFGADDALFRGGATILHFDSLAENLSKDAWNPEKKEGWLTLRYKAHRGFDDFSDILWPEKFPEARLRQIRAKYIAKGDRDGYSQEYLNIPIAEGENFFRPEDLLPMEQHDYITPKRYYCAWDYAISQKEHSDFTVCVVIGIDDKGTIHVIDVRRGRWDGRQIVEEMFSVQKAHNCIAHFAEAGAIEKAIGPFLYEEMRKRSQNLDVSAYFNVEPVVPTKDKVTRAVSWRARTRAHSVKYDHTASWWPALLEEMSRFPKGEYDDQVDPQSLLGMQLDTLMTGPTSDEVMEEEYVTKFGHRADIRRNQGRSGVTGY